VAADVVLKVAAGCLGGVLTLLYLRRYLAGRRRAVEALVASGAAEWAANCRVDPGADLLADAEVTADPRRYPAGLLVVHGGRLEWRPDAWSVAAGWRPGSRPLADVRLVHEVRRRSLVGARTRTLRLTVPGGEVVAVVAAEAGTPPPQLAGDPPRLG
jgi:hypothetical protein